MRAVVATFLQFAGLVCGVVAVGLEWGGVAALGASAGVLVAAGFAAAPDDEPKGGKA